MKNKKATLISKFKLQFISHFVTLWSNQSTDVEDGVGLVVLDQEDKWMVSIEQLGVPELFCAKDAGVKWVTLCVPFPSRCMEHVRKVEIFLARDVGQISLGLVHRLCETNFSQVFLWRRKKKSKRNYNEYYVQQ